MRTALGQPATPPAPGGANPASLDTSKIDRLTGIKGKLNAKEGVFKVSMPRADLKVTVGGVKMTPPMGLTSWAAFKQAGDHAMVMGDIVLLQDQVFPVMKTALASGLEVTALHNHFFWDSPNVMFMHIGGMGNLDALAKGVGKVFAAIKATSGGRGTRLTANLDPAKTSLDPKKIDGILSATGELAKGVYKITIGRTAKMGDTEVGNTMGINTWAAFVGSDAQAVVDGDIVMTESQVQPVLKALTGAGIYVVAIHSHMLGESPRMVFLHYWGIDSTTKLAKGIKAALDTQKEQVTAP